MDEHRKKPFNQYKVRLNPCKRNEIGPRSLNNMLTEKSQHVERTNYAK